MEQVLAILNWCISSGPNLLVAIVSAISALIAVFLLIPGEQPEKFLQGVLDFLSKFSKK